MSKKTLVFGLLTVAGVLATGALAFVCGVKSAPKIKEAKENNAGKWEFVKTVAKAAAPVVMAGAVTAGFAVAEHVAGKEEVSKVKKQAKEDIKQVSKKVDEAKKWVADEKKAMEATLDKETIEKISTLAVENAAERYREEKKDELTGARLRYYEPNTGCVFVAREAELYIALMLTNQAIVFTGSADLCNDFLDHIPCAKVTDEMRKRHLGWDAFVADACWTELNWLGIETEFDDVPGIGKVNIISWRGTDGYNLSMPFGPMELDEENWRYVDRSEQALLEANDHVVVDEKTEDEKAEEQHPTE